MTQFLHFNRFLNKQKQLFADVLQNRYSEIFCNNHRKTLVFYIASF